MPNPSGSARRRAFLFFGISLLVAGGTALLVQRIVSGYEARISDAREGAAVVTVVTAAHDLTAGVPLAAVDLQIASVPKAASPEGTTFREVEDAVGLIPHERVLAGEVLRRERVAEESAGTPLALAIEEGWRAAAIRVDKARGVGGLLRPGDKVDVIVTIRPDDNSLGANWVTQTILQDALVLAVGPAVYGAEPDKADDPLKKEKEADANGRWDLVTLEVLPEEAEKLALANSRGDLALTLRTPGDEELMENAGPTVTNALLGLSVGSPQHTPTRRRVASVPAAPPPPAKSVEVIQGSRTSVQSFDAEGRHINDKVR